MKSFDEELASALASFSAVTEFTKLFYDSETAINKARSIRRYATCETVPAFDIARDLCSKLGIVCTEQELLVSLELAKDKKRLAGEKYYEPHIIKKLNVKANACFKGQGLSIADKDAIVSERIRETTLSNTQAEYVAKLIEYDGNNRILPNIKREKE